ncbi:MAG: hypothetical protein A2Y38_06455 [Spirochaetes bacterium GWB1_59_5]|nr:MAG: hypothetical protein A2Y38_06455 [Spirochaetes bacterium GWB1_59_5]
MKLYRRIFLAALFAATLASVVAAQATIELAAVRELALAHSSALRKAELAYESATLAEKAQTYKRLPSLSASAGASLDYLSAGGLATALGSSARLSVSQAVYDGGKLAAQSNSSGIATEAAAEAVRGARVNLIGQADAAFYTVLKAEANAAAAVSDLDAAALRLRIAKAKAEAGVIAQSDYLQAESEAAARETALIKARKTLSSARAKLASMTGLTASVVLEPIDFSRYDSLLFTLSALDEEAVGVLSSEYSIMAAEENPELAGYALAARKATIAVDVARSGYAPSVSAGLSQGIAYGLANGFSVGAGSLTLSATMSLDLWSTATGVRSAETAAAITALEGSAGAESLILDIDVAVNGLLSAAQSITSSAKALEYAESNYRNVLEKFSLSAAAASDLSAAEALVSTARTGLIGARYDFLAAISELRGLVGLESEDRIVAVIP